MVNLRSRRLETALAASPGNLGAQHVHELVTNGVQEAVDLEWEAETYGGGDCAKRELAKNVAALANTAGGVIVIGVAEDTQARATATPGGRGGGQGDAQSRHRSSAVV